jgi:hypothetical protein
MNSKHIFPVQKKSNSVSAASQQPGKSPAAGFLVDNRGDSVAQRKLNEMKPVWSGSMNGEVVQAKSIVKNQGQAFVWGPNKTMVGHHMKAWLDPKSPLQGESANINKDQTPMMDALRKHYVINGGDLVKGHLLNDNLGGKALSNNLFPITRAANKQHLVTTENYAKKELWTNSRPLWYTVDVTGVPNATKPQHAFSVALGEWNMATGKEGPKVVGGNIVSNMGDPRDMDGANPDDLDSYSAGTLREAMKKGRALHPHTKVGTMNAAESKARDQSGAITRTEHDNSGYTHVS